MKINRIEIIGSLKDCNPDDDWIDVHLHLNDGRIYAFTFVTPLNFFTSMNQLGTDYFFGEPCIVVRALNFDNISRALTALISDEEGDWVSTYGTLQEFKI